MKYSRREDRYIIHNVKKAKPYESKRSIRTRYDINRVVDGFSSGLGSYGDATSVQGSFQTPSGKGTANTYTPRFKAESATETQLLDKYYISSHLPPMDILTELGDTPSSKSWVPLAILAVAILFLFIS